MGEQKYGELWREGRGGRDKVCEKISTNCDREGLGSERGPGSKHPKLCFVLVRNGPTKNKRISDESSPLGVSEYVEWVIITHFY